MAKTMTNSMGILPVLLVGIQSMIYHITLGNVFKIASSYLEGADREHIVVIMLDTKNQVIGISTVANEVLSSCPIHPREVFKPEILANVAGIILLYNHHSGDPCPSQDDLLLIHRLKEVRGGSGVQVVDHMILEYANYASLIGEGRYKGR